MQHWLNVLIQGVLLGGLYALFAAGLSLIFGVMRLVNIAHGDLIIVAAYMAFVVTTTFGVGPFVALIIILPAVAVHRLCAAARPAQSRARRRAAAAAGHHRPVGHHPERAAHPAFTPDTHRLHAGAIEMASLHLTDEISVGVLPLIQFVVAVAIIGGLQFLFYRTAIGRAFRATSDDGDVAQLMGLETRHIFALAMALSLIVVAVAGVFIAIRVNFDPFSGPILLIFGFEAVIIGGLGSLWGTLVGGILLGIAQTVGGQINVGLPFLAGHLVFLAVLLIRPQGLFPKVSV